MFLILFYIDF